MCLFCKNCGKEIDDKTVICPSCGAQVGKKKESIFRRWWFWLVVGIIAVAVIASTAGSDDNDLSGENTGNNPSVNVSITEPSTEGLIGDYIVKIKEFRVTDDFERSKILVVTYSFTNNSDESKAFLYTFDDALFQNGVELSDVYSSYGIDDYDFSNQSRKIKPGVTLDVQVAYKLNDETTDIDAEISELFSLNDEILTYTIKIEQ